MPALANAGEGAGRKRARPPDDRRDAMVAIISAVRPHNPFQKPPTAQSSYGLHLIADTRYEVPVAFEVNREARAQRAAGHPDARTLRYRIRTAVERTNARLKDEFGARHVRVRGPTKVAGYLMFGLLALTADRIIRLAAP